MSVTTLKETAWAKVNLALHVRARRADGYHEIESLFAFLDDGDVLTAEETTDGGIRLSIDGPFARELTEDHDNLVLKAAHLLRERCGSPSMAANVQLTKRLPVASGIGGGSADAAAALRLLIRLWGLLPSDETLRDVALSLGSDVPACLLSQTQFVAGRGERLDTDGVQQVAGTPILLVNPLQACPTGPVFRGWDQIDRGPLNPLDFRSGRNDLTTAAIASLPAVADVLDALASGTDATLIRMSGSGATCFALFDSVQTRDAGQHWIAEHYPQWWSMKGLLR